MGCKNGSWDIPRSLLSISGVVGILMIPLTDKRPSIKD